MANTRRHLVIATALLTATWAWAGTAAADDERGGSVDIPAGDSTVVEDLVETLCEGGELAAERCSELYKKMGRDEAALPAVSDEGPTWDVYWNNGTRIERSDGMFKVKMGGRIMVDFGWISQSPGAETISNIVDGPFVEGFGVEFRRARLFMSGEIYKRILYKAQFDFRGGDVDFNDVYVGMKLPKNTRILVGHQKEPYSLEQTGSSKYLTFMERGLPIETFGPTEGRNTGVKIETSQDRWYLAGGFFLNTDSFGDRDPLGWGDTENYNLTFRGAGTPLLSDDGTKLVHVGASYGHGWRNQLVDGDGDLLTPVEYATDPEFHLTNDFVNTGEFGPDHIDRIGLEFATVCGPFSVQSEYVATWSDLPGVSDREFLHGVYAYASYFLTGESRPYDKKLAAFTRLKPKANFNPGQGDWGAWEVAFRYSWVDLNDTALFGGELWDITAALNWYLFPNARVMMNYVYAKPELGPLEGHAHGGQIRFQVDF